MRCARPRARGWRALCARRTRAPVDRTKNREGKRQDHLIRDDRGRPAAAVERELVAAGRGRGDPKQGVPAFDVAEVRYDRRGEPIVSTADVKSLVGRTEHGEARGIGPGAEKVHGVQRRLVRRLGTVERACFASRATCDRPHDNDRAPR